MVPHKKKSTEEFSKDYKLITLDKVKEREQKLVSRMRQLKFCLNIFIEAAREKAQMDEKQRDLKEWQDYLSSTDIMPPYKPSDIRSFIQKQRQIHLYSMKSDRDWSLFADERSILTQNPSRIDKTHRTLEATVKPEIGYEYNKYITNYLKILHNINQYLSNDTEVANIENSILMDLNDLKYIMQKEIRDLLDCYTCRILGTTSAYMNSVDAISSDYFYSSDNFQIYVWTLKGVPIRFTHMTERRLILNLHNLNIILHVPYSVLEDDLTIQALHLNFDMLTENAISFKSIVHVPVQDFIAGIKELPECLHREWNMQMDIQKRVREDMKRAVQKYDEFQLQVKENRKKLEKSEINKTENQKKEKSIEKEKSPRKVQMIQDNEYPDIYELFLKEEYKLYKSFMNIVYSPTSLELKKFTVNLKQFSILGGIYQIQSVNKLKNIQFNQCNMMWHSSKEQPIVYKNFRISETTPRDSNQSQFEKRSKDFTPHSESINHDIDPECPWFVLSITLPEHLCLWGTPVPCHYEEFEDIIQDIPQKQTIENQVNHLLHPEYYKHPSIVGGDIDLRDENELNAYLMMARRKSFRPEQKNFYQASLQDLRKFKITVPQKFILEKTGDAFHIEDFLIKGPINHQQENYLKTYCLPQIVSSYKFHGRFTEDKPFKLIKKSEYGRLEQLDATYSYDANQNAPERLFPIFSTIKPIIVTNTLMDYEHALPYTPITFYQLVKVLTLIKRLYEFKVKHIENLPQFQSNVLSKLEQNALKKSVMENLQGMSTSKNSEDHLQTINTRSSNLRQDSKIANVSTNTKVLKTEKRNSARQSTNWVKSKREQSIPSDEDSIENSNNIGHNISDLNSQQGSKITYIETNPKVLKTEKRNNAQQSTLANGSKKGQTVVFAKNATENLKNNRRNDSRSNGRSLKSPNLRQDSKISNVEANVKIPKAEKRQSSKRGRSTILEATTTIETKIIKCSHWTTEHIRSATFNRNERRMIIETDRLGYFGFAFKRYEHYPFKDWILQPNESDPENAVTFILDTQYVRCFINITSNGITGYVTEQYKGVKVKPKIYLEFDKPMTDFNEFKKCFQQNNINIFADHDAQFYIEKEYFSEKHLATELHTYLCMILHCTQIKFCHNMWNRLAKRRDIILNFTKFNENNEDNLTVRLTPEEASFVTINEDCSPNLDIIKLDFKPTWRNFESYADLHYLICSVYPELYNIYCHDAKLICYLRDILFGIRPLSFS